MTLKPWPWQDVGSTLAWNPTAIAEPMRPQNVQRGLLSLKPGRIHLALSSGIPDSTPYATLSHCWGLAKHLTLTRDKLDAFRIRIPEDQL